MLSGVPIKSTGNTDARQLKFVLMTWLFINRGKAAAHFLCFPLQHLPLLRPYLGTYPDYSLWSLLSNHLGQSTSIEQEATVELNFAWIHMVSCCHSEFALLQPRWATRNKSHQGAGSLASKINMACGCFLWRSPNLFPLCRIKSPLRGNQSQFTLAPHRVSSLWKVS